MLGAWPAWRATSWALSPWRIWKRSLVRVHDRPLGKALAVPREAGGRVRRGRRHPASPSANASAHSRLAAPLESCSKRCHAVALTLSVHATAGSQGALRTAPCASAVGAALDRNRGARGVRAG